MDPKLLDYLETQLKKQLLKPVTELNEREHEARVTEIISTIAQCSAAGSLSSIASSLKKIAEG